MKRKFENDLISIKRRYFTDIYLDRILVVWTFLAVIVVGYYGIGPLWGLSKEKRGTIKQMEEINNNLESNFNVLDALGQDLILTGKNIRYIYEYMPSEPDLQNYLVDFVGATSQAGFSLVRFTPNILINEDENNNVATIKARIEGEGDLVDLAKGIEDLKRISSIQKFEFSHAKSSNKTLVSIDLEIYYMDDQ
jgi:hypothetical protein